MHINPFSKSSYSAGSSSSRQGARGTTFDDLPDHLQRKVFGAMANKLKGEGAQGSRTLAALALVSNASNEEVNLHRPNKAIRDDILNDDYPLPSLFDEFFTRHPDRSIRGAAANKIIATVSDPSKPFTRAGLDVVASFSPAFEPVHADAIRSAAVHRAHTIA